MRQNNVPMRFEPISLIKFISVFSVLILLKNYFNINKVILKQADSHISFKLNFLSLRN